MYLAISMMFAIAKVCDRGSECLPNPYSEYGQWLIILPDCGKVNDSPHSRDVLLSARYAAIRL